MPKYFTQDFAALYLLDRNLFSNSYVRACGTFIEKFSVKFPTLLCFYPSPSSEYHKSKTYRTEGEYKSPPWFKSKSHNSHHVQRSGFWGFQNGSSESCKIPNFSPLLCGAFPTYLHSWKRCFWHFDSPSTITTPIKRGFYHF